MSLLNEKIKNFTVIKHKKIEEIKCELIVLKHNILDTEVIKIKNDDDENLFSLSFKTYPSDSTGAPHILEHTVLCGSKKFFVKDPFFSMLKRSLNTFMNAMTGCDFTCYPAASIVEKDFYNLLEVYLDAVFNPILSEMSFKQEAYRYEFSKPKDITSKLILKGIVYNEMKGAMSNPDSIMIQKLYENLMPDLIYKYNSGGDPDDIPSLTYENLLAFHDKFYHPSRCLFFFYGNLDLEKQLDFIEKNALQNIDKKPALPVISKQKRFKEVKKIQTFYPIAENEDAENKYILSLGFLTCPLENQIELISLSLLDEILMGSDGAYLKLSLLKSNLCKQVESYFDSEIKEPTYVIVCKDFAKKDKTKILDLINKTLNKIILEKIPNEIIDAALHQLEFSRTEISTGSTPYGLSLFFRSALAMQHNLEPENSLEIHSLFNKLKSNLEDPNFLTSLIKKYFLDNTHKVELTLVPDKTYTSKLILKEDEKLLKIQNNLSQNDKQKIVSETEKLINYQKNLENSSSDNLPIIKLTDIPKKNKNFALDIEEINNFKIFHHDNFTNEILYTHLLFDFPKISSDELFLIPIFSSILCDLGCGKRSYIENQKYIQANLGSIDSYLILNIQSDDCNNFFPSIGIKAKSLNKNASKLFSILKDTVLNPHFLDFERIKQLLKQQKTYLESSFVNHSMSYATITSQSSLSIPASFHSIWNGPNYLKKLCEYLKDDKSIDNLMHLLDALKTKLFCINTPHLVLSCSNDMYLNLKKNNFYDLVNIECKKTKTFDKNLEFKNPYSTINQIEANISFTASSYKTANYLSEDAPFLLVASKLFANKILHRKIREQGGAYGSGAKYSPTSSIFTFTSYRDPHIQRTLDTFKFAIDEIAKGNFTSEDLFEAKLSVFQDIDSPVPPSARAIKSYTLLRSNITDKARQNFREKVFTASKNNLVSAVKNHLLKQRDNEVSICFAGKDLLEKEKKILKI